MRRSRRLAGLLILCCAIVPPSIAPAGAAAAKQDLVIGVAQFPASLHPNINSQTTQFYTLGLALRPITAKDRDGELTCLLCTELPTIENGLARRESRPDGKPGLAVTIKLKPELKWGDGVALTARDLAFTWKIGHDPAAGFSNTHFWSRATGVDVVDDHTAVLHLDNTYASYNEWDQILPEHIEGAIHDAAATPLDYVNTTLYNRVPLTAGLWNGPYLISGYLSNSQIEFSPNPFWTGTRPGFRHIVIRLIENTAALQANLLSGDVDLAPVGIGLTIDEAMAMQAQHPADFVYFFKPQPGYEHIDIKRENPMLQDVRVRRALLHGINVASVVRRLFGGHAEVARTFINGLDPHYTQDVPTYPFDPARAAALLAEAGWRPGPDGVLRDAQGHRMSLEFSTTSGNRARELTQQVMQNQWKAIGVEVVIANQPSRTFFGQLMRHREYTALAEYASTSEIGLVPVNRLSSALIPSAANNWSGGNYPGIRDAQLDADLAEAEVELDPARQQALWADMQQIYATQLYSLPLYYRSDPEVIPTWLKGYTSTGKEDQETFWAEEWRP
jgi:peptide/nickel transport system substrate-binding protein